MLIGFVCVLMMGFSLGLLGAGGSILTVPILVYLFNLSPVISTSYSLLLVGFTSAIGAFVYYKKQQIDFNIAIKFAIPSLITVYATRRFVLPEIPDHFMLVGYEVDKNALILMLFAAMMLLTSFSMIRSSKVDLDCQSTVALKPAMKNALIILESVVVGFVTAMIGAGGGFLIVPALVLFNKIDVKMAVGSSLFIIAIKSLVGFLGDVQAHIVIDYYLSAQLLILAILGMFAGVFVSKKIDARYIKKGFGYFVMLTAIVMIIKEVSL